MRDVVPRNMATTRWWLATFGVTVDDRALHIANGHRPPDVIAGANRWPANTQGLFDANRWLDTNNLLQDVRFVHRYIEDITLSNGNQRYIDVRSQRFNVAAGQAHAFRVRNLNAVGAMGNSQSTALIYRVVTRETRQQIANGTAPTTRSCQCQHYINMSARQRGFKCKHMRAVRYFWPNQTPPAAPALPAYNPVAMAVAAVAAVPAVVSDDSDFDEGDDFEDEEEEDEEEEEEEKEEEPIARRTRAQQRRADNPWMGRLRHRLTQLFEHLLRF